MKKYVIIVAGGIGKRMNNDLPKQLILIKGRPILYYTINSFLKSFDDIKIIVVLPEQYLANGKQLMDTYFSQFQNIAITKGGYTRFHSVQNGLNLITEECIVFVHDGVRAMVSTNLIQRCYNQTVQVGSAIPVIHCRDSARIMEHETSIPINRDRIRLIQTPQTFKSDILIPAFNTTYQESFTDEATVVEAYGKSICLIEGEETNIKITYPIDLTVAEKLLS